MIIDETETMISGNEQIEEDSECSESNDDDQNVDDVPVKASLDLWSCKKMNFHNLFNILKKVGWTWQWPTGKKKSVARAFYVRPHVNVDDEESKVGNHYFTSEDEVSINFGFITSAH
jgi:hypothetical protein